MICEAIFKFSLMIMTWSGRVLKAKETCYLLVHLGFKCCLLKVTQRYSLSAKAGKVNIGGLLWESSLTGASVNLEIYEHICHTAKMPFQ
jgi:hypothetical protein